MNINDIKRIACLGGGIIGSSWATAFVYNGYEVNIYFPLSDEIAECDKTWEGLAEFRDRGLIELARLHKLL